MRRLFRKTLRDLIYDRHRAVVSLLVIIIGLTAFGTIFFSYHVIKREIAAVFTATNPASASVIVDRVDENLIRLTEEFEGISDFEVKGTYPCRVRTGETEWKTLQLFASDDYALAEINKVTPAEGSVQPNRGEALIEINALGVADTALGNELHLLFPDGSGQTLKLTGTINDLSVHPAYRHNLVYAYVSFDTLAAMDLQANKIEFMAEGGRYDRQNILEISNDYSKLLEENGYTVKNFEISATPGVSVHLEEYEGSLFLFEIFSFVAFLFGCMIVSNLLSSILSGQIRQIGILKAVGADTGKILAAFLLAMSILVAAMTAVSLLVAFVPISRGLKITVKDAISDYGIDGANAGISAPLTRGFLSGPVCLSLRIHRLPAKIRLTFPPDVRII